MTLADRYRRITMKYNDPKGDLLKPDETNKELIQKCTAPPEPPTVHFMCYINFQATPFSHAVHIRSSCAEQAWARRRRAQCVRRWTSGSGGRQSLSGNERCVRYFFKKLLKFSRVDDKDNPLFTNSVHSESSVWNTLMALVLWDVIFAVESSDTPLVWFHRLQTHPLDMFAPLESDSPPSFVKSGAYHSLLKWLKKKCTREELRQFVHEQYMRHRCRSAQMIGGNVVTNCQLLADDLAVGDECCFLCLMRLPADCRLVP